MTILPPAKQQQLLDLIAVEPCNTTIARAVGVTRRTVARYRSGGIPQPPTTADAPHCRRGHPYPENLRKTKQGKHYCHACRRARSREWAERNPSGYAAKSTPAALAPHAPSRRLKGDWRHHAQCLDEEPELFFPTGTTGPALLQTEEARAVCYRCPVLEHCAQWALDTRQEHGVWGGYDEHQRRGILRRLARGTTQREPAKCGTRPGYKRHHREGTPVCKPCADANRTYTNTRNQTLKETA